MLTSEQIAEARALLDSLRRRPANVKRDELEKLAYMTGRQFVPKKGGEPRYEKRGMYPLAIPGHRVINKITVLSVLKQLEDDLDREEEELGRGS